jgi:hypothetical protein
MESIVQELGKWGTHGVWVLIVACATVVILTSLVTSHRRKSQRDEMDTTLKLEMIQRGMSVDEIERVLSAKSRPDEKSWLEQPAIQIGKIDEPRV